MKYLSWLSILLSTFLFSLTGKVEGLKVGDEMPAADVKMKNIDRSEKSLNDYIEESGLLVVFSCNTCPFVIGNESFEGWEEDYEEIRTTANENGFGVVLINSNEAKRKKGDGFKDMVERAKEYNYKMPYLYDENHRVADAFGAKTTPHIYLFDEHKKLIYTGAIDDAYKPDVDKDAATPYLMNAIRNSKSEQLINPNTTPPKGCSIKRKS
jgi:thioredoxin-related protein